MPIQFQQGAPKYTGNVPVPDYSGLAQLGQGIAQLGRGLHARDQKIQAKENQAIASAFEKDWLAIQEESATDPSYKQDRLAWLDTKFLELTKEDAYRDMPTEVAHSLRRGLLYPTQRSAISELKGELNVRNQQTKARENQLELLRVGRELDTAVQPLLVQPDLVGDKLIESIDAVFDEYEAPNGEVAHAIEVARYKAYDLADNKTREDLSVRAVASLTGTLNGLADFAETNENLVKVDHKTLIKLAEDYQKALELQPDSVQKILKPKAASVAATLALNSADPEEVPLFYKIMGLDTAEYGRDIDKIKKSRKAFFEQDKVSDNKLFWDEHQTRLSGYIDELAGNEENILTKSAEYEAHLAQLEALDKKDSKNFPTSLRNQMARLRTEMATATIKFEEIMPVAWQSDTTLVALADDIRKREKVSSDTKKELAQVIAGITRMKPQERLFAYHPVISASWKNGNKAHALKLMQEFLVSEFNVPQAEVLQQPLPEAMQEQLRDMIDPSKAASAETWLQQLGGLRRMFGPIGYQMVMASFSTITKTNPDNRIAAAIELSLADPNDEYALNLLYGAVTARKEGFQKLATEQGYTLDQVKSALYATPHFANYTDYIRMKYRGPDSKTPVDFELAMDEVLTNMIIMEMSGKEKTPEESAAKVASNLLSNVNFLRGEDLGLGADPDSLIVWDRETNDMFNNWVGAVKSSGPTSGFRGLGDLYDLIWGKEMNIAGRAYKTWESLLTREITRPDLLRRTTPRSMSELYLDAFSLGLKPLAETVTENIRGAVLPRSSDIALAYQRVHLGGGLENDKTPETDILRMYFPDGSKSYKVVSGQNQAGQAGLLIGVPKQIMDPDTNRLRNPRTQEEVEGYVYFKNADGDDMVWTNQMILEQMGRANITLFGLPPL